MDAPESSPLLRIGELSRRLGVSGHVLRAWESRYGLLQPVRSAGGFRLYSEADALRVRRMQAHLTRGLSAAEPPRAVLAEDSRAGHVRPAGSDRAPTTVSELSGVLRQALDAFDEPAAQAVLDRLVSDLSLTTVLRTWCCRDSQLQRWAAGYREHRGIGSARAPVMPAGIDGRPADGHRAAWSDARPVPGAAANAPE